MSDRSLGPVERRDLGSLQVHPVGLGTRWFATLLDRTESARLVAGALDVGLDLLLTTETDADGEAEVHVGRAIGPSRDDVVLATTVGDSAPELGVARLSREHVRTSVDASLRRLQRDWIDLYVLRDVDPRTSLEETLTALHELVVAGKVRELGIGELPAERLEEVVQACDELALTTPVAMLVEYGPHRLGPDQELLPAVDELGLAALATSPLAGGRLIRPDDDADEGPEDRIVRLRERLIDLARHQGRDVVDLALSWTTQRRGVAAAGASARTTEQIAQLGAVGLLGLDGIVLEELDERITTVE